jgi:stalled ribosome rescue protein Dom34
MDHSEAHLIAQDGDSLETTVIKSEFSHQDKQETLHRSENTMHHKEQHLQAEYYKKISQVVLNYDDVIVFGPTDAKLEFINILAEDALFDKIKIDVKPTDKMTENQEKAFVKEYFKFHGF